MSHIKNTIDDDKSWCGEPLGIDFYFKDSEAAIQNGRYGDRPMCDKCVNQIIEYLQKPEKAYSNGS